MEIVATNHRFNNWIYEEIRPFIRGDTLEIGSGIGTISQKIIEDSTLSLPHLTLTDISLPYVHELEQRFAAITNNNREKVNQDLVKRISVRKLDLNLKEDYETIGYDKFNSVIAINVLEHIEDDDFALRQLYRVLKKGGNLITLVPCHKFLFNVIDKSIDHFRRYNKKELVQKLQKNQFSIRRIFYFNALGMIGWYVNGNIFHNPVISPRASRIFDALVPFYRHLEKLTGQRTGLSLICCASK